MLDFMRRRQSSLKWVWVILIFIFSVTLVTLYIPFDDLSSVSLTNDVGSVGQESISAKEFQTAYRNYIDSIRAQLKPEMLKAFRFDKQIMDSLVLRHVVNEEARRLGLGASTPEIEQKILENPVFREGGNFIGQVRYQNILAQNNLTVDEFESSVRNEIMSEKLKNFITASLNVTDQEIEEAYKRQNEKTKVDYFIIDPALLADKVTVNEKEQRDYFEKNKATYSIPEKRQAKYVFVATLAMRPKVTATDDELLQYFNQHRNEYQIPETVRAQHILFKTQGKTPEEVEAIRQKALKVLDRAKKGEDFGALAKQFSEDTTASNGGDLGTFRRGQMVPEFDRVAFSLEPGAISDLVQTQFGFHIIKVTEKHPAVDRDFAEMKEAIRPIVLTRKAEQQAADIAQQVAVDLIRNNDMDAVAAKYGVEVKETPLVQQGQAIPELGEATELSNRIFAMAQGEIGTAIPVDRGYVVPTVTNIVPTHPASFEEVQSRVAEDAKNEKARQLATEKGNQVQELEKAGKDLQAIARTVGAEIKTSNMLTRTASLPNFGSIAGFADEMFSLPVGKMGKPITIGGKTLAYAVTEREEADLKEMAKSMDTLRNQLVNDKRERYFNEYIQEARKRMETSGDIKINESVMTQIAQSIS